MKGRDMDALSNASSLRWPLPKRLSFYFRAVLLPTPSWLIYLNIDLCLSNLVSGAQRRRRYSSPKIDLNRSSRISLGE